jgi:hypothetical protein
VLLSHGWPDPRQQVPRRFPEQVNPSQHGVTWPHPAPIVGQASWSQTLLTHGAPSQQGRFEEQVSVPHTGCSQRPATHGACVHEISHEPQWRESVWVSTQVPRQHSSSKPKKHSVPPQQRSPRWPHSIRGTQ